MNVTVPPAVPMFIGAAHVAAVRHDEISRITGPWTAQKGANRTYCPFGTKQGGIVLFSQPVAASRLHGGLDRKEITAIDDAWNDVLALAPAIGIPESNR